MNKEERCETCHFHDGVFCRKNAPLPLLTFRDVMHEENWRPTAWWPETGIEEWCGEYRKKSDD